MRVGRMNRPSTSTTSESPAALPSGAGALAVCTRGARAAASAALLSLDFASSVALPAAAAWWKPPAPASTPAAGVAPSPPLVGMSGRPVGEGAVTTAVTVSTSPLPSAKWRRDAAGCGCGGARDGLGARAGAVAAAGATAGDGAGAEAGAVAAGAVAAAGALACGGSGTGATETSSRGGADMSRAKETRYQSPGTRRGRDSPGPAAAAAPPPWPASDADSAGWNADSSGSCCGGRDGSPAAPTLSDAHRTSSNCGGGGGPEVLARWLLPGAISATAGDVARGGDSSGGSSGSGGGETATARMFSPSDAEMEADSADGEVANAVVPADAVAEVVPL